MPEVHAAPGIVLVPPVTHLPAATPSKLYDAMASGRPVATPSTWSAAMARGRPVVLVAEAEPATIVREQEAGLVVGPGDIGALSGALRTLSRDPNLRQELGANG